MTSENNSPLMLALADIETLIVENPQQAEAKVLRVFSRAQALNENRAQLVATMQLARIAWHLNQYDKGINLCRRAEQLLLPEFESQYLSELYHIYAQQYWGLEQFRSAHHFWNLAMEKSLVHNQLNLQIESLIGVANIWRVNRELELSYSALSLAMTLAEQYDFNILAGQSAILLSRVLNELNQHTLMLEVLAKAESFLYGHPDSTWHAEIQDLKSMGLATLGHFAEAEQITQKRDKETVKVRGQWVETYTPISRAMVAIKLKKYNLARQFLDEAESVALRFNQLELLAQLYLLRFDLESHQQASELMLLYFKKYRKYSIKLLRSRSLALGQDRCELTVDILNYKAELLIGRLEAGAFNASEGGFPAFREASIWLYACQRAQTENHSTVFILELNSEKELIAILPIVHALCQPHELITRFKNNRLALLLDVGPENQGKMLNDLKATLLAYPWWRIGKTGMGLNVRYFSIDDFLDNKESYLDKIEGCE
ncbi:hypothetical protein CW745_11060 [Psychromonas sp. psych-6C06]|uniref:hypothetical protein n=1 Tax=Psychromonas sp. psych-6C06 TaxID=2058089 RepID=UPI000C34318F|nr:hypothetical protein [Psychromonas sp. psych-6C06]PKF61166.1 hypothetical protein CW745_11060 [Psychromonas sp. psych-6C06]